MSHKTSIIDGRECFVSDSVQPKYILVQTLGRHERSIFDSTVELISNATCVPFVLVAFQVFDWDLDLTPWHDDAINRKPEVGTMTGDTLRYVTESLLPELEKEYGKLPVILGGYSLGGLFALWSSSQTDRFAAIAPLDKGLVGLSQNASGKEYEGVPEPGRPGGACEKPFDRSSGRLCAG